MNGTILMRELNNLYNTELFRIVETKNQQNNDNKICLLRRLFMRCIIEEVAII